MRSGAADPGNVRSGIERLDGADQGCGSQHVSGGAQFNDERPRLNGIIMNAAVARHAALFVRRTGAVSYIMAAVGVNGSQRLSSFSFKNRAAIEAKGSDFLSRDNFFKVDSALRLSPASQ